MIKQLQELAINVMKIAEKAGNEIMRIYESSADPRISYKADQFPLTVADQKANEIILEGLKNLPVKFPVVSEESNQIDYEFRKNFGHFWLVDPLDGTKEFIKRNGEFTVNIALIERNKPVLGVVYAPFFREMFWAAEGEGAFFVQNEKSEKLYALKFGMTDPQLKLVCSRSHSNADTQRFIENFKDPEIVSRGSSLKFMALARGEAHIYPRLAPTMEWDTAAAQIIVEESGGKIVDVGTGTPLIYNKASFYNPFFIAFGNVNDQSFRL